MSVFVPYFFSSSCSGLEYKRVPTDVVWVWKDESVTRPKSPSFTLSLRSKNTLLGFISLWEYPRPWINWTASHNWQNQFSSMTLSWIICFFLLSRRIWTSKVSFLHNSIVRYMYAVKEVFCRLHLIRMVLSYHNI